MTATAILASKVCSVCKDEKPASEFHRNKASADGLCSRCKPCNCAHVKKARDADPEKTKRQKRADYEKHREKRIRTVVEYYVTNRDAILESRRAEYHAGGKEAVLAQARDYYLKNSEKVKVINAIWAKKNPERVKAAKRRWIDARPGLKTLWDANRRANEKQATPSWANLFFIAEAYRLAKLREKVCGGKWHVDHIVPLQSKKVCGLHVEHNLQVIPGGENLRKSNRHWPDMP